jgi:hypothetical protein
MAFDEAWIERPCLGLQTTELDYDPGLTQAFDAATGDPRIGIDHGADDPCHTGTDQGIGTGWRAPLMRARLQGHIDRGTAGLLTGLSQGQGFSMRLTGAMMPALADDSPIAHQHTADTRIGICGIASALGQPDGMRHIERVATLKVQAGHPLSGSRSSSRSICQRLNSGAG